MMASRKTMGVMAENHRLKIGIKLVVGVSAVVIFSLALALFLVFHHHKPKHTPTLPIFQLRSFYATPLSNTLSATWNLSISLTNPNPKHLTLSTETLTFTNFYYPNASNDSSRVRVGDAVQLGRLLVPAGKHNTILLPPVVFSFSTHSVGAADAMIIRDQASGRVEAGLTGSVRFRFGKKKTAHFMGLSCIGGLTIGYQTKGNGFVSNLPRNLEIFDLDY